MNASHSPADRTAETGVVVCVLKNRNDFSSNELMAVRASDAKQRLVVIGAVQSTFVHVESFSRQLPTTFCKHSSIKYIAVSTACGNCDVRRFLKIFSATTEWFPKLRKSTSDTNHIKTD